jgi:predicted O-linked N-acetylglucosamine transferase (SPINDLY family)
MGQLDDAVAACRSAIALRPNCLEAHNTLGNALWDLSQLQEAIGAYRRALAIRPDLPEVYNNLGNVLRDAGQLEESLAACGQAIALRANYPEAFANLGNALRDLGRIEDAVAAYRQAIALNPNLPEVHNNLGNAWRDKGQPEAAAAAYRQAIALKPNYAQAFSNLGNVLKDTGQLDEAIAAYRQAVALKPNYSGAHSNLVYTIQFHPGYDATAIVREHARWNRQHAQPLRRLIQPHAKDRDPDRRLRIGYVSPDFRDHVVGRNMLPLLRAHDRQRFEIACYALMRRHDALTLSFQALADIWRDVAADSDDGIADMIRRDRIDILVDLALHMDGNRLLVFARKPAPVQVTFAGYPGTTGLETIDYRLTDPHLDPPGMNDAFYSEASIRLPDSFWCYDPSQSDVAINELPATGRGWVTFGCLNNFCKVNDGVLAAWSAVLAACPNSRILILAGAGEHRGRTVAALKVDPSRVEFIGHCPREQYLKTYHQLDIVLDTYPYNGHTTTCDALWMGVPVVSLAGQTAVGRGGSSILSTIGLPELVADSQELYVRLAIDLAHDTGRLGELRSTLRQRMAQSPLMDAPSFARNVEAAYRQMWRTWCGT